MKMELKDALELAINGLAFWKKWSETMEHDKEFCDKLTKAARLLSEVTSDPTFVEIGDEE